MKNVKLPDDWKKVKLKDITELITKGTTPTTIGYNYTNEGINFVKIESITNNGEFLINKMAHISEKCNNKMMRSQLKENDIVFSIAGAIGRTAMVSKEILPANTNQALAIIRLNTDAVYTEFLLKSLRSEYIFKQFEKKKQGVAQLNLSLKDISELEIMYPSTLEQKNIVTILNRAQEVIDKRKEAIRLIDELVKSRFIEMFGNPVSNPKGWKKSICKDITSKIGSGATPKGGNSSYKEEGISLIRSMNVYNNKFIKKDLAFIDDEQAQKLNNVIVEENDVLLNITGASVARCCIVPNEFIPARVNQHVAIIRSKNEKIFPIFLLYQFTNEGYQRLLWDIATSGGATREAITKQQIENLELIVPPIDIQNKFIAFANQVDKLKFEMEKSLKELENNFNSLMQRAFKVELFNY